MAVTYMKRLEDEPDEYFSNFSQLTKGINIKVNEWILDKIGINNEILEIGCGPGVLSKKMAKKGNNVVAIDRNPQMIIQAQKGVENSKNCKFYLGEAALYYPPDIDNYSKYEIFDPSPTKKTEIKISPISTISVNSLNLLSPKKKIEDMAKNLVYRNIETESNTYDFVVSTFMLSELRPFEQQIFLRRVWNSLKPQGKLIISAEFIPNGISKLKFYVKRRFYNLKLKKLKIGVTNPLKYFYNYLDGIGFKISDQKEWSNGSIRVIELEKIDNDSKKQPGYYTPKAPSYKGIGAFYRKMRCLLTGQVDHIGIEPGFYKIGNPDRKSPILVTANYDYTYINVRNKIDGIDAWLLCVDSDGVNVWCSARGNNFGNKQLYEAIEATNIPNFSDKKTLILPQLAAGGVSKLEFHKSKKKFPYNIRYGPVWAKDLPKYLIDMPKEKPKDMKTARFSISHRFRAGITHTTFLFRKLFLKPTLFLLLGFVVLFILGGPNLLKVIPQIWIGIILTNILITFLLPITEFTRKFINKGIFFGFINVIIIEMFTWFLYQNLIFMMLNSVIFFWIAFLSTMSFSGYTFATSPTEIQGEYELFSKINRILLVIGMILSTISLIYINII